MPQAYVYIIQSILAMSHHELEFKTHHAQLPFISDSIKLLPFLLLLNK